MALSLASMSSGRQGGRIGQARVDGPDAPRPARRAWDAGRSRHRVDLYIDADNSYTTFGLSVASSSSVSACCLARLKPFFRGETLYADTPILVPDTGVPPRGGL
jgi:hypothetical protein